MLSGREKGVCKGYRIASKLEHRYGRMQDVVKNFSEELNLAARTGNILRITW